MRVVIARDNNSVRGQLREAVLGVGLECAAGDCVSFTELPQRLLQGPADLILLTAGVEREATLTVLQQTAQQTRAPIFVVGDSTDSQQILQLLRQGAREYLHEDQFRQELVQALSKLRQNGTRLSWGKVLAAVSARPGVGVTTVASNLAFALTRNYPQEVVVAELGEGVPELALHLDLLPPHPLTELVGNWQKLDATVVRQALVGHSAGLKVLAHPPDTLAVGALPVEGIKQVVLLLRSMFTFAVLDLGSTTSPALRDLLPLIDNLIVLLQLDIPAVRLTRNLIERLDEWEVPRSKLQVVVNRFGQRRQFDWRKAQQALPVPIVEWIPDDPGRINEALNRGMPLVEYARWAPITRRFLALATRLNGVARERVG